MTPKRPSRRWKSAGWQKGSDGVYEKNGTRLSFKINCGEGTRSASTWLPSAPSSCKPSAWTLPWPSQCETDWAGQEAYLIGWGSPFDPDDHTYKVFGTDKGANYSGYSYDKVDELLKKRGKPTTMRSARNITSNSSRRLPKRCPSPLSLM